MENKHVADELVNGLKGLTAKLEQLQVDAALGKADAKDKIREYQKELKEFTAKADRTVLSDSGILGQIRSEFEQLEVQAHLGEAELKDFLKEQKKNLDSTITKLTAFIKKEFSK